MAWTCTNENSFFDFRKNIYQTLQIWLIQLGFNTNFDPKEFDCLIKHHLNDIQINETVLKVKNFQQKLNNQTFYCSSKQTKTMKTKELI